jgi:sugar lactone lactonase YvrE
MSVRTIPAAEVEHLVAARAETGEGPLWDDREQVLWWVDIPNRALHRYDPASGHDTVRELSQMPGAVALREAGGLVLAVQEGFALLGARDLEVIAAVEADRPDMRMNDGYCDAQGRFWAGTMRLGKREPVAGLYRLDPDRRVTTVLTGVCTSNGIDWSPDGKTMYYIDSGFQTIDAFDMDPGSGELRNRRNVVRYTPKGGHGDGLVVDAEGHLWVALWGGSAVHRYSPQGELELVIEVPATQVTKPAFGGPDLEDLYITTAAARHPEEPLAGDLFRVRGLGVRGQRIHRFQG